VEFPLHAKYSQPFSAGLPGWRWLLSGSVDVEVPAPWLLLHCPGASAAALAEIERWQSGNAAAEEEDEAEGGEGQGRRKAAAGVWAAPLSVQQLLWRVPSGNLDHAAATALITTAVSLACSGAVVWAALHAAWAAALKKAL
jgi:hypothetical protein